MQLSDPYMGTLGGYLAASVLVTPDRAHGRAGVLRGGAAPLTRVPLLWLLRRPHHGDPGPRVSAHAVVLRGGGEAGRDPLRPRHRRRLLQGEAASARDRPWRPRDARGSGAAIARRLALCRLRGMPTLATIPRSAAAPPRALASGPAGKSEERRVG